MMFEYEDTKYLSVFCSELRQFGGTHTGPAIKLAQGRPKNVNMNSWVSFSFNIVFSFVIFCFYFKVSNISLRFRIYRTSTIMEKIPVL